MAAEKKKRPFLLRVLIVAVILVAVPFAVGLFLPEHYEGATSVALDADVDAVWDALQDVEAHPMTGTMMKSVEPQPDVDGLPSWIEDMGRGERIVVTTIERDAPRRLVRAMESQAMGMTSRWEYTLAPDGDGCRVTISGATEIPSGSWMAPAFRFMMMIGGGVESGFDAQMDMVAETLGVEARREG